MIKPLVRALRGIWTLQALRIGDVYLIKEKANFYEGIPGIWEFVNVNFKIYKMFLKFQYQKKT